MIRSPKKILFLGLGGAGQRHLRLFREALPNAELISYRKINKTPTLGEDFTIEDVSLHEKYKLKIVNTLKDGFSQNPELAVISYPTKFHNQMILECAKNNINVFVEKPGSISFKEAQSIKNIVEKNNIDFFISFQRSFHPIVQKMYELISSNKVGSIISIRVNVGSYVPDWHPYESFYDLYACQDQLGGGVITTECHELNILLDLFGLPLQLFSSTNKRGVYNIATDDSSTILMQYERFSVSVNLCFMQKFQEREITIIGTDGHIKLDLLSQSLKYKTGDNEEVNKNEYFSNDDIFKKQLNFYLNEFPSNSNIYVDKLLKLTKLFDMLIK